MKKIFKLATLVLTLVLLLNLSPTKAEAATKPVVRVSQYRVTLYVGGQKQIKQTGSAKKYSWWSDNQKVASVSSKGVIKAKRKGTATVVLKSGNKKSRCIVTVKAKLTAKQVVNKMNSQMKNYKNMSISVYIDEMKYSNLMMKIAMNRKDKIQYVNLFGINMYSTPKKIYWRDEKTKKWYYEKNTDGMSDEDFEADDTSIPSTAKCKLLADKTFNGVKCAVLQVTDGDTKTFYYFDLKDYSLIGGEGEEVDGQKAIYKFDFKTTVKVPTSITKSAKYKEFNLFEE